MAGIDAENARKAWEIENEIETLPASDEIFRYDAQEQQQFLGAREYMFSFEFIIFNWLIKSIDFFFFFFVSLLLFVSNL